VRLLVPAGWRVTSDVAWYGLGVCGVGNAQPVFSIVSPDGLSAIEFGHALQLQHDLEEPNWNAVPQHMAALIREQMQQQPARMAQTEQTFRQQGDACHVGTANSAHEVVQRYVLPYRRPNGRILGVRPEPKLQREMQQAIELVGSMPTAPGLEFKQYADAATVEIDFPNVGGPPVVERITLGVLGSRALAQGLDMGGGGPITRRVHDNIATSPVASVRAPRDRLPQVEAIASVVFSSMRYSPEWNAAMQRLQAELQRMRHQGNMDALKAIANRGQLAHEARQAVADSRMQAWRAGQAPDDRAQQGRIDSIYEVERRVDPATGAQVGVPIHYQGYYSNGRGDVLMTTQAGTNPRDLFPGENWQEMAPAR
jgi:hypothetical protein